MGDYSQAPQELLRRNRDKGYVGIHIEQGVPILDRDLNLLQDLMAATMREVFTRYIGNGTAHGNDGFAIEALSAQDSLNNFSITAGEAGGTGTCLVGGIEVSITQAITYRSQHLDDLTTPTEERVDLVYLDVTLTEEDGYANRELLNHDDVGIQTSVRIKPAWTVRVHEGHETLPEPLPAGHAYHPLALLIRPAGREAIEQSAIKDLRKRGLTVSDVEFRLSRMERMLALPAFTPTAAPEFRPQTGVVNQSVILSGIRFDVGTVEVFFDDKKADLVTGRSTTQIVARVPPGLTPLGQPVPVTVSVSNEVGTATARSPFTVQPDPVFASPGKPFSPDHGTPGTEVDIFGFNFDFGTPKVFFAQSVEADVLDSPSPTHIKVRVPDGLVPSDTSSVLVTVSVQTAAGTAASEVEFRAEPSKPKPTFDPVPFIPKLGRVTQGVTLRGTNFDVGTPKVLFGDKEADVAGAPTATTISTTVPTGLPPGPVSVTVKTEGGDVTSGPKFTVQP